MLPLIYGYDIVNFILSICIWLYLLSKLCRHIMFKIVKMFISKVDLVDKAQ